MQKSLISLANVAGLDINNAQHTVAIADAVKGISDIEDFIEYVRVHKAGIEYATKTERLDILASRYKQEAAAAAVSKDAATFSSRLAEKVKMVRTAIKNEWAEGRHAMLANVRDKETGAPFFTDKELRALVAVAGSTLAVIEMSERDTLQEALERMFIARKTQKRIANTSAAVRKLVEKVRA
ncbi:hypothetical protein [Nitratifractor salsuginis]|uniref:Uncharacterized protein n=1 Tax=Nitratifractor salsuginis (strain DSM 16511 / JCM 12458 / E9I37-1) TaxID=749222 RepID=E6X1Q4_NITSE|nr:hypothetical protein [Nitratifractor salsuginis]ADV47045.1 hypothetical protein Nitsa_1800 [Nitratifractor salsuginis DSM 16511]